MSRPRSGREAKTGGRTSRPAGGARGVYVTAPKSDIYVALLGVALGAMALGCLLLVLVWSRYGFSTSVAANDFRPAKAPVVSVASTGISEEFDTVRL